MDNTNLLRAEAELKLNEARRLKAERIKTLGSPIQLPGIALAICIRAGYAWIAENTTVARKVDLESGKTVRIFRGHTAPVSALAIYSKESVSGDAFILITGSWDKAIKLWDAKTGSNISSTVAHQDFVKAVFVFPSLQLLISGSSDKIVRFWDLSSASESTSLKSMGSISSHTRPVECLEGRVISATSATLYTADTMGVIKIWNLKKESGQAPRWRSTLISELNYHRTGINEICLGTNQLWTASSDESAQLLNLESSGTKPSTSIIHPVAVRCILPLLSTDLGEPYLLTGAGDIIRCYDVSSPEKPELLSELDAHWHDVTALRLWERRGLSETAKVTVEPWIVSASLDGTIRKWKLKDLLYPPVVPAAEAPLTPPPVQSETEFQLTEDEERELADLLDE